MPATHPDPPDECADADDSRAGALDLHADADAVERLLDAAEIGVACDGLRASRHHDGYTVAVPGRTRGRLSRAAAARFLRDHPVPVTNWRYWADIGEADTARWAFLRWVERAGEREVYRRYAALAGGVEREWGQLLVRARLAGDGSGERRYELRHVDDAGADRSGLAAHDDPRDAREIATHDDRGRYRPLKTAPSLRAGWTFSDLAGPELVCAVDFFYPATVANWHRERRGGLDVTHYREAAERQTGIYDVIEELPPESVAHLAEACCVDSQCLRRREWDESADVPLGVERGDSEFPCREPCSLVVSAARKVTTLESETPREYTVELTPSEKNQMEAILDAVAEGRTDEVREADFNDGANRYRARYLRAKRLTERGLSDVPTFGDGDE